MKPYPFKKTYSGKFTRVQNQDQDVAENSSYYHLRVRGEDFLFTNHQMRVAQARAHSQPEDNRARSLFKRLLVDWWR
jgi:hypothetical protein